MRNPSSHVSGHALLKAAADFLKVPVKKLYGRIAAKAGNLIMLRKGSVTLPHLKAGSKIGESAVSNIGLRAMHSVAAFGKWLKKPFRGTHPERGAVGNSADKTLEIIKDLRPERAPLEGARLFKDVPKRYQSNVFDIMENLPQALKGNRDAASYINRLRPHELTANFKGWTSLDLVPNNPRASPLRFLYKKQSDGTIKWMIKDTH